MRKKTDSPAVLEVAQKLAKAAQTGKAIDPVRDALGADDLETAYAVQEVNTRARLDSGARLVGRKIGLTAPSVQKQLGVDQPDYGMLFADMWVDEDGDIPAGRLLQPKVEAEIAFVLDRDLTEAGLTNVDVARATAYVAPAIEIVDSRIRDWDISIVDTIADNASSGMFVLGSDRAALGDVDLRLCGMVVERRGEPVSTGAGAACLGNPLNAVRWLAERMVALGRPLVAGDVVLSGALGPMVAAGPGNRFEARISGLGSVRVGFE